MFIIGCVAQKGGVGKSAISRLLAREFAAAEYRAKIADMDVQQSSSTRWVGDRIAQGHQPTIEASFYNSVGEAIRDSDGVDVLIFDGKPAADKQTTEIAKKSHLVVLPTGVSLDDLRPTVQLMHALMKEGVPAERMVAVILAQMSAAEEADARAVLQNAGARVATGALRRKSTYAQAHNIGRAMSEAQHAQSRVEAAAVAEELANIVMGGQ